MLAASCIHRYYHSNLKKTCIRPTHYTYKRLCAMYVPLSGLASQSYFSILWHHISFFISNFTTYIIKRAPFCASQRARTRDSGLVNCEFLYVIFIGYYSKLLSANGLIGEFHLPWCRQPMVTVLKDRRTDRQAGRGADRQTDKQTDTIIWVI